MDTVIREGLITVGMKIVNNGKSKGNEVIARKNSDGELTLTIY